MHLLSRVGRACLRALIFLLRCVLYVARVVFILCLIMMPVPATLFLARQQTSSGRRNLPALVLRKK